MAALALIFAAILCIDEGFDRIDSLSYENEYVDDEADNLTINGTYFTGYMVLGVGFAICASIFLVGAMIMPSAFPGGIVIPKMQKQNKPSFDRRA
jgi:hypothetical protein